MRKNVRKEEIGPMWVNQSQPHAVSSAMSFTGPNFYSYGTCIGSIVKNKAGETAYLVNDGSYSSSSSAHRNVMLAAIPKDATVFMVPGWNRWVQESITDHKRTVTELRNRFCGASWSS
jgi:hypothetical protein